MMKEHTQVDKLIPHDPNPRPNQLDQELHQVRGTIQPIFTEEPLYPRHYFYFLISTCNNLFIPHHNYEVVLLLSSHLQTKKLSHWILKKVSQDDNTGKIWSSDSNPGSPAAEPEL